MKTPDLHFGWLESTEWPQAGGHVLEGILAAALERVVLEALDDAVAPGFAVSAGDNLHLVEEEVTEATLEDVPGGTAVGWATEEGWSVEWAMAEGWPVGWAT